MDNALADTSPPLALVDPPQAPPQEPPPPRKPLASNAATLTQFVNNQWTAVVPDDLGPEDFEDPALWVHAGRQFAVRDTVQIVQGNRWTLCLVSEKAPSRTAMTVLLSCPVKPPEAIVAASLPPGYEIRPAPPSAAGATSAKYAVVRLSDGSQMNKNQRHETYEEARAWLLDLAIFRAPTPRRR